MIVEQKKRRFPNLEVVFLDVVEILHIVVGVNRYIVPKNYFKLNKENSKDNQDHYFMFNIESNKDNKLVRMYRYKNERIKI